MYKFQPNTVYAGKMEIVLPHFPPEIFHSIVCDPPYGLGDEPNVMEVMKAWLDHSYYQVKNKGGFMGKQWDAFVPQPVQWKEAYRVLKPGGFAVVACGTRTVDWMGMALRFAGFQIRDIIPWHYGTGFPKSMDISKQIDKEHGAERKKLHVSSVTGKRNKSTIDDKAGKENRTYSNKKAVTNYATVPSTEDAKQWDGYGTALKPATELFILAQKPITEKTIAKNVLNHGTGCLNINGCRIAFTSDQDKATAVWGRGTEILSGNYVAGTNSKTSGRTNIEPNDAGRWPANLILDPYAAAIMDKMAPKAGAFAAGYSGKSGESKGIYGDYKEKGNGEDIFYADSGGASRFFYCAKPTEYERNKGFTTEDYLGEFPNGNDHVTVKPIELMRWLVRLVTPKGGTTCDPFAGSGSTICGASVEGINWTAIDMDERNKKICDIRVKAWNHEKYTVQRLF